MKIALSLDSACDLSKELIEKYGFYTLPFGVNLGDRFVYDGEISVLEIFDWADKNKTLPKTNAINEETFSQHFEKLLKTYDAVIHFSISSEISCAFNNAVNTSKRFKNVFVIDSKSLSTGIALLAIYARKLTKTTSDAKKIVELVEKRVPHVQASFIVERLDYLHRGGRCSAIALLGANILKIRPQIEVVDGKLSNTNKFRGKMDKCVADYCNSVLKKYSTPDKSVVFITHSHAEESMIKSAREVLNGMGFENVYETTAGCTISSHCGKNTLGILYLNDGDYV